MNFQGSLISFCCGRGAGVGWAERSESHPTLPQQKLIMTHARIGLQDGPEIFPCRTGFQLVCSRQVKTCPTSASSLSQPPKSAPPQAPRHECSLAGRPRETRCRPSLSRAMRPNEPRSGQHVPGGQRDIGASFAANGQYRKIPARPRFAKAAANVQAPTAKVQRWAFPPAPAAAPRRQKLATEFSQPGHDAYIFDY